MTFVEALALDQHVIRVPEETARRAERAIRRMVEIA